MSWEPGSIIYFKRKRAPYGANHNYELFHILSRISGKSGNKDYDDIWKRVTAKILSNEPWRVTVQILYDDTPAGIVHMQLDKAYFTSKIPDHLKKLEWE